MRSITKDVSRIIAGVKKGGDRSLESYSKKFDGVNLSSKDFHVTSDQIKEAYLRTSDHLKEAFITAKKRIELFHKEELKRLNKNWTINIDGVRVGQIASPIESVGIYVPGGRYPYPSTLLMTAIPAKIAGISKIVVMTPPKNLKDEILAVAYICGIDQLYGIGGPAAIAALAYGTETIPKVDKIIGPGNIYVAEAKRQVFGEVGIDGLTGPSEIAVWADTRANINTIAINLLAQAEHDPLATSYLLVQNRLFGKKILQRIPKKLLRQVHMIIKLNAEDIIDEINRCAPEHLYMAVRNPKKYLHKIRNAGAIFLGEQTPVALGDYAAGPSHVLPTAQSSKFNSGLSIKDFFKWSSVIENRSGKNLPCFRSAQTIANAEGLRYHALSLGINR